MCCSNSVLLVVLMKERLPTELPSGLSDLTKPFIYTRGRVGLGTSGPMSPSTKNRWCWMKEVGDMTGVGPQQVFANELSEVHGILKINIAQHLI